ncbi:tRNA (adenosine(37)-N6)-threonylcarbamoyltransferase complex ATPase subunit type 1 TsaE [Marinicauda salina]|uniref:tRNA threonylcarbamoyladenosine biosynthesis protein TsaE n=1 Tax=Marinicauda salina TaxID=2135793 RepID=A0A2U2BWU2_9PROT|nr:tRNA (adenosine(37)-N6)-threonylcarbamoyltransferase complex ATPase subunit type 1 TsaE [Marinicauda salina]PWE18467.1 tRNA (adenosine(37)-N6)-threonylcarbamoyltransferase complex ATPase subunit type 1 TsaE [Marinicauda salina]
MDRLALTLPDAAAADAFGRRLATLLAPGDAVLLAGDLGAGKTTIARGVIAGFAGVDDAPSPTYTLVQAYENAAGTSLVHADLYRVEDPGELEELGLDEALETGALLVEWPDRLDGWRPETRLEIALEETPDGGRRADIAAYGGWEDRLGQLA